MKKTSKPSNTGKSRHSKATKKPVTIDLKAESVKTNPKPEDKPTAKPAEASKSKTRSVPKVEPKAKEAAKAPASKSDTASTAAKSETKSAAQSASTSKSSSDFGRNAKKEASDTKSQTPSKNQSAKNTANSNTPQAPAKSPNQSSSQWPGRLVAGIVGGVIVLAGSTMLGGLNGGSSSSTDSPANADLTKRISALESQLKEAKTVAAPTADMSAINAEIDAKIKQTAEATQTKLGEVAAQASKTDEKLNALETQLTSASEKLANVDVTAVGEKVAAVSSQIDEIASQAQNIDGRIASLEDVAENKKPAPETAAAITALQAALPEISTTLTNEFDGKLKSVSEKLALVEKNQEALPKLTENIASIETGVADLKGGLEAVKKQSDEQQGALATLKEETQSIAAAENKAASSVAAAALKNDIDQGQPFENSLKNLEALGGQSEAISGLTPFAKTGVPTVATLQSEFSQLGEKIIQATAPKPTGDLTERLLSSAKSFIKAKPIKEIEGTGAEAIVSQISANLTSGNISQASELWASLPEAGQAISKSWHERLQARVTADNLLSSAVQSFLNSTASQ